MDMKGLPHHSLISLVPPEEGAHTPPEGTIRRWDRVDTDTRPRSPETVCCTTEGRSESANHKEGTTREH